MMNATIITLARGFLLSLVFVLGLNGTPWAAEYWLRAEVITKTMPDASVITMWAFAQCTNGTYTTCSAATVPGPELIVPTADSTLTVHLRNNLTGLYKEPVSIVIPGQKGSSNVPVWTDNASGNRTNLTQRVKSFTVETPANNSTTVAYSWSGLKAGTYLYQSGTHPAVQVQMGLYGAMTREAATGQAYDAATSYDIEAVLLFSEIDPALHTAVSNGTYATLSYPSTYNYEPKYFLINGAPYSASSIPLSAGISGSRTLLRILNAGLKPRVPVVNGLYMSVIAEDGNKYLYPKEQYSMLLAAGKTMDAIITPGTHGNYAVYDRRLALTNAAVSGGGMLAFLNVASTSPTLGTLTPSVLSSAVGADISFSAVYSDADGYTDLRYVYLLVNTSISGANAIFLLYDRTTNRLYLMNDDNTLFLGSCTPGVAGTLTNTQGTLNCGTTTVSGLGNNLTVNWNITPKAGIIGTKNLYLYASDMTNASSGWIDKGNWTITPPTVTPTLGTLTPSTVAGPPNVAQNFSAVYSHVNGYTNLSTARLLINSSVTSVSGIYVFYDRNANRLYMYNDSGTAVGSCIPSLAGTLTNTQGTLNCQATTVTGAGNNLTVNWNITPSPTFTGTKNLYMYATDSFGARVGWVDKGDWTITSSNVAPTLGTLTPSTAAGPPNIAQNFSAVYSDANGYGNLSTARLLINSSVTSVNGIYVFYDRNANRLYMYNDSGTAVGSCTPSVAGTLTNTQGTLNCQATTVTGAGNNLTVNWNITPSPTFTGARNLYMYATDNFGARVGWVDKGDWTISP